MAGKGHRIDPSVRLLIYQQHMEHGKLPSQIYKNCFQSCNPIVTRERISRITRMFDDPNRELETESYLLSKRYRGGRPESLDECALPYLRQIIEQRIKLQNFH